MPRGPPRARAAPDSPAPAPGLQPHGAISIPDPAASASAASASAAVAPSSVDNALLAHVLSRIEDLSKRQGDVSFDARCAAVTNSATSAQRQARKAHESITQIKNDSTRGGLAEVADSVDKIATAAQRMVKDLGNIRQDVMEAASAQDIRGKLGDVETMILSFVEDSSMFSLLL